MKAPTMSTTSTAPVAPSPLPLELIQTGLQQVTQARDAAMVVISNELQALLPAVTKAIADNSEPEGIPEWAAEAFTAAGMKKGRTCWKTLQEHLARRTAELISATPLAEQVTGGSLAGFLGLDLYALAADGWPLVNGAGPGVAGGAL